MSGRLDGGGTMKILAVLILAVAGFAADDTLNAEAGCSGGKVVVRNKMTQHWIPARIVINRTWEFNADAIRAGDTMQFVPGIFTKRDGTRLDLSAVTCKTIDIHATVNGKRMHANFGKD